MRRLLLLLALISAAPAAAEVKGQNASGFTAAGSASIDAAPEKVWAALVQPSRWWNAEHSWSGYAANLSLDPRAGGCFCEALPNGGSVEHMRVIYAAPARQLRMAGALGPMQGEGLAATLTVIEKLAGPRGYSARGRAGAGVFQLCVFGDIQSQKRVIDGLRDSLPLGRGSAVIVKSAPELRTHVDVWGPIGDGLALMKSVKQQFDPAGVLSPGRGPGGL